MRSVGRPGSEKPRKIPLSEEAFSSPFGGQKNHLMPLMCKIDFFLIHVKAVYFIALFKILIKIS
jgi:hypothetical protein